MKFSAACLFLVAQSTSAFAPNSRAAPRPSSLLVVTDPTEVKANNGVEAPKAEEREEALKIEMPAKTEEPVAKKEEPTPAPPASFLLEDANAGALEP